MKWIIIIFLAVVVGYILAESFRDCIGCISDCFGCIAKFIKCILNRSDSELILHKHEENQDESVALEKTHLIGMLATAVEDFKEVGNCCCEGYVKSNGTHWKAVCKNYKISDKDILVIKGINNLTLEVEPVR